MKGYDVLFRYRHSFIFIQEKMFRILESVSYMKSPVVHGCIRHTFARLRHVLNGFVQSCHTKHNHVVSLPFELQEMIFFKLYNPTPLLHRSEITALLDKAMNHSNVKSVTNGIVQDVKRQKLCSIVNV